MKGMAGRPSKRKGLSVKERQFVKGLARGLTQKEAALRAGYADTTAHKKAYDIIRRPLVQSALTEAFLRIGGTMDALMLPIAEGVKAKVPHLLGETRTSDGKGTVEIRKRHRFLADHPTRLKAAELGMNLFGGMPKQLESPPVPSQGLTVIFEDEAKDGTKRRLAAKLEQSGEPVTVRFDDD